MPDRITAAGALPADQGEIDTYLEILEVQRKFSSHTVSNYRRDLQLLLGLAEGLSLKGLTQHQIRRFVSKLHAGGISPRSIARKLSAWRGFYQWLAEKFSLPSNPIDQIRAPRQTKPLPKALSVDDAVQLVATRPAPLPGSPEELATPLCNQAMFELLYSSGLRVSELAGLDFRHIQDGDYESDSWINLQDLEMTVTGKGNKKRIVPVGHAAAGAIAAWLSVREKLVRADQIDGQRALFINQRGTRISARTIQIRLKEHARALELPLKVHPHVLRHSFASHVLQSSGDLRAVQEMLGHASIASTQVYTALDYQHLARIYDATHPRAKKK